MCRIKMKPILFVYSALIFSLLKTDWALGKQSEILFENGHYIKVHVMIINFWYIKNVLACTRNADCSCNMPICCIPTVAMCPTSVNSNTCYGKDMSFLIKLICLITNKFYSCIVMSHISLFRDFNLSCYQFFCQYRCSSRRRE